MSAGAQVACEGRLRGSGDNAQLQYSPCKYTKTQTHVHKHTNTNEITNANTCEDRDLETKRSCNTHRATQDMMSMQKSVAMISCLMI